MATTRSFTCFIFIFFALLGNVMSVLPRPSKPHPDWDIDFDTLLYSSLGDTPAIWLASQSIVAELNYRDHVPRPGGDGAAAGSFLASLFVSLPHPSDVTPSHDKRADSATAVEVCQSLVDNSNATAKDYHDPEVLERVIRSMVGNGFVIESAKGFCKNLVPGIETAWEQNTSPVYDAGFKLAFDIGFKLVLNAHLTDMGVGKTQARKFVSELEARLRMVDRASNLEAAFEHLMRELMASMSSLVLVGTTQFSATSSLKEFTKLSYNALRRLPHGRMPVALSDFDDYNDPVQFIGMFTEIAMKSSAIAADLGGQVEMAAKGVALAMDHLHSATEAYESEYLDKRTTENPELKNELIAELNKVAGAMRELVDTLPPVDLTTSDHGPRKEACASDATHARTVSGPVADKTAVVLSEDPPQPTTTALTEADQENLPRSLDARRIPWAMYSFTRGPGFDLARTSFVGMALHTTLSRIPEYTPDGKVYTIAALRAFNTSKIQTSSKTATRPLVFTPSEATETSLRTLPPKKVPRQTSAPTTSYATTVSVTEWRTRTVTDYECKHGAVKKCYFQFRRLCWYDMESTFPLVKRE